MPFTRRRFISSSTLALAGTALSRLAAGAQPAPQAPPAARFEDIRRNVGIFTGQGGTIGWLATPDGALAVDAQFPATAKACVDGLQQRAAKGIQVLVNTHHHGDHTSGNPVFRPAVKWIVQHERCAQLHKEFTTANNTASAQAYADVTFGDSWSQTIGGETVWARHFGPGHTGGDALVVFEKANVVHWGDLMFHRLHPRVDRPGGASIRNWMKILERGAGTHNDAIFIFGHAKGGLPVTGGAKDVLHLRDYFSAVLEHVQRGIQAGRSLEEIAALEALPRFEDYASSGQILSLKGTLTAAYEELTSKTE